MCSGVFPFSCFPPKKKRKNEVWRHNGIYYLTTKCVVLSHVLDGRSWPELPMIRVLGRSPGFQSEHSNGVAERRLTSSLFYIICDRHSYSPHFLRPELGQNALYFLKLKLLQPGDTQRDNFFGGGLGKETLKRRNCYVKQNVIYIDILLSKSCKYYKENLP